VQQPVSQWPCHGELVVRRRGCDGRRRVV